ncbi:nucleotidyltransferase domain-containing protein [Mariprofundus ferrooxydans]|nr:nucleotidyltransferase domain-containing protein [Mariprofundus ferrooxydans]
MRLNKNEIEAIVNAVSNRFSPDARIYLFGSRINDAAKGGDIDLLVDLPAQDGDMVRHSCQAIADIQMAIGEQKIDLIVRHPDSTDRAIFHEALKHGELLA